MGFSGYLNPFTNEAQVDGLIPTYKFPTTSCHEVAHQLGYAAENEANFIGSLATIHNKDDYFKYAGYTFALRYCLAELFRRDSEIYYSILPRVNYGIIRNYQEVQTFWMDYENPLEPLFDTAASSATYIVEAGYRSGTRNTANHARVIGREVFALPGPWAFAPARGANAMIAEGLARPYPLTSFPIELSMNQKRIQDAMRAGARFPDEIAAESGLSLASVLEELKPA